MGKLSTKENKNIYQRSREQAGLTRAAASEQLYMSASRIEKIENGSRPHPDEVLKMAECYRNPALCNDYCCHLCEIGQKYVPKVEMKELSQITLEMLASLNALAKEKDRLIEITVDGRITEDEVPDFLAIQKQLEQMSLIIDSLQLWIKQAVTNGEIDPVLFGQAE
ncbi:MAG: helix-turn-helix domain-containing protein [Clostridiales bacterium]|nr:helix-turn-helix domain-containing protein [Clostridiales bacterium]